jgi:hypothetical protein
VTHRRAALFALAGVVGSESDVTDPRHLSAAAATYVIAANSWNERTLEQSCLAGEALLSADLAASDRQRCLISTLLCLAQRGLIEQAVQLTRTVDAQALEQSAPAHRLAFLAVLGLCHLTRGAMDEAQSVSSALCSAAVEEKWPLAYGVGALIAGRIALQQARPRLALRRLSESLASFEYAAPTPQSPIGARIGRFGLPDGGPGGRHRRRPPPDRP